LLKSKRRGWWRVGILVVVLLVFSALLAATWFLVLAILSMSIDEMKNTQKNGSRGKGIVVNPQR
jgi:hypothetical protein